MIINHNLLYQVGTSRHFFKHLIEQAEDKTLGKES